MLAQALAESGAENEALDAARRALQLRPGHPQARTLVQQLEKATQDSTNP